MHRYPVRVEAETFYLEEQSTPEDNRYAFAYTITISNLSEVPVTLRRRRWLITDSDCQAREVAGDGVVGKQPCLQPGTRFRYTSGAMLETPVNTMEGEYEMETDAGECFLVPIDRFTLSIPRTLH